MVLLYDPTAARRDEPGAANPTLATLSGKVVGFIDNAKPNFNHLVDDLAELLVAQPWREAYRETQEALGVDPGAGRDREGAGAGSATW